MTATANRKIARKRNLDIPPPGAGMAVGGTELSYTPSAGVDGTKVRVRD